MHKQILYLALIILLSLQSSKPQSSHHANNTWYDKQFEVIDSLLMEGLPRDATPIYDNIFERAIQEKNYLVQLRAVNDRMVNLCYYEEKGLVKVIDQLKGDMDKLEFPINQVGHSILGNLYWQYYQQNRWRIHQRTTIQENAGDNIETWDLKRIMSEVIKEMNLSLENPDQLYKIPVDMFDYLLVGDSTNRIFRPSLLDLLTHRVINLYRNDETGLSSPVNTFTVHHPKYFNLGADFSRYKIPTNDSLNLTYRSVQLFQQLTHYHVKNANKEALFDLELNRLKYIHTQSAHQQKDSLYMAALNQLEAQAPNTDAKLELKYQLAHFLYTLESGGDRNYYIEASQICKKALSTYPNYSHKYYFSQLLKKIEEPSLHLQSEQLLNPNTPNLVKLDYKNLDTVYFKVYQTNLEQIRNYDLFRRTNKNEYINKEAILEWQQVLPKVNDYREHHIEVPLKALEKGFYNIVVSDNKELSGANNATVSINTSTNMMLLSKTIDNHKSLYTIYNRDTGIPIENAKFQVFESEYNYETRKHNYTLKHDFFSDSKGNIEYTEDDSYYRRNTIIVSYKEDSISISDQYRYRKPHISAGNRSTILYTDRAIYRPGQTIHFKGLMLDRHGDTCSIVSNKRNKIHLHDANGQELSSLNVCTNEYGTFSGTFTIPTGLLNGRFSLRCNYAYQTLRVEEYKRPTFEIKYKPVTKSFSFNDSVKIDGTAQAYAGYPIDNATIIYRINRKAEARWGWYWGHFNEGEKQVAVGNAVSDKDGNFSISYFTDDRDIKDKNQIYAYTLTADITDANGETRSDTHTLRVSQSPLMIKTEIPDVIFTHNVPNIKIETNNINSGQVITDVQISTTQLVAPKQLLFDRAWEAPDQFLYDEATFKTMFPHRVYKKESDPENWKKGKTVFKYTYQSNLNDNTFNESFSGLKRGYYLININAIDSSKQKVKWQKVVRIIQTEPEMPIRTKDWITPVKTSGEPGEVAEFWVAALSPQTPIRYELLHGDQVLETKIIKPGKKIRKIEVPILEKYRGGFAVQFVQVVQGQSFISLNEIKVPYTNKKLDITFTSFRNKLLPGSKEQWKLSIKNKGGEKETAEMMATLYDASLDAFAPLKWPSNFIHHKNHTWHKWNGNLVDPLSRTHQLSRVNHYLSWWNKSYETLHLSYNYFGHYNPHYRELQNLIRQKKEAEERRKRILERHNTTLKKISATNDSLLSLAKQNKAKLIGKLSGVVRSYNDKEPIPGVNIKIYNSQTGTVSDFEGNFSLKNVPKGIWLEFSFIGYKPSYHQVLSNTISVVMEEETHELDDVVVVGYGTQKKSMVTGSIAMAPAGAVNMVDNDMEISEELELEEDIAPAKGLAGHIPGIKTKKRTEAIPQIKTRKNFNETAFFYPHLQTDENGEITIDFTIPEALTRWKMMGFAHTKDFKTGSVSNTLITQKDVSIMVNTPRFLRENDTIYFAAKVNNISDAAIKGHAYIQLFNAINNQPINPLLLQSDTKIPFSIDKGQSEGLRWKLVVPAGIQAVHYKVMAKAGKHTDGEENILPVLVNSKLVTESMPFMLRPQETAEYRFDKMVDQSSSTLRNESYTIEYTSNPAWYAIQAMPYLMEYPYECAEQVFSRFFANSLSSKMVNSSPKIREVFNTWKTLQADALVSNLEKNQELKELLIQETPWLRNAQSETERKKRLGLLFDLNHMSNNLQSAFNKLQHKQTPNGGFAWFEGMPDNRYITQHVTMGLAQLQHLKAIQTNNQANVNRMIQKALHYLDARIVEDYKKLQEQEKKGLLKMEEDHLSRMQIHYLYTKSFFAPIIPNKTLSEAYNYFYNQAKTYGLTKDIYSQAMLSIVLNRSQDDAVAKQLIKSLDNRTIRSKELGMYWKSNSYGYYWYQAPIETQAMLIEAFDEVSNNTAAVEEMKIWLLRNKQTYDWKTTKATVAACYALLLRGTNQIAETELLQVNVGGESLESLKTIHAEAGTGYVKTTFTGNEIKPEMGELKVHNPNNGVAWGAAYWQYFEQLDKITSAETELKIVKKLYVKEFTEAGAVLQEIKADAPIQVGDEVVVRVEINADRDYEYVHLKDMRASGFEPVSTLSEYKYRDGLGYYESVKDASENFFISYMRKGVYVFEYSLRAVHAGSFSNGITSMQCMYAPEFSAHSEGIRIEIKK
ncbi:alpha-2-macroglobulin family protein [Labilibacter marinus]|uniref:alpha-2-macroglobulin family protein n=1 Tax=Labilibacter marinus TaxID=1477105 RepID=UPI00094FDC93|nr:alpha-2-macroglobulin family protein [Labilibacter marinus]